MKRALEVTVDARPNRPLLVYDGECRFCRLVVERWSDTFSGRVDIEPAQSAAGRLPEIPREAFEREVYLVTPDGRAVGAAAAVLKALALGGGFRAWWWLYRRLPPFAAAAESAYRFVADHRRAASRITRALWGSDLGRPTFRIGSDLFLRGLGLTYIVAFASLGVQVTGLAGKHGIQPMGPMIEAAAAHGLGFGRLPTVCLWLGASDTVLRGLCVAGGICGALLLGGLVPTLAAAAAWLLYLSLCTPIVPFMSFQWDALLLEAGLLAIFLPPPVLRLRWRRTARPSRLARFLLVWLLARLMFSSGVVKLTSGDAAWSDLTALTYHYWTQPLPPWTAWYLDKMPLGAHKLCCVAMFVVELGAPLLLFLPRRLRHLGGTFIVALMGVIAASGNYGFFNLLTVCLCLLLFDDSAWRRLARIFRMGTATERPGPAVRLFRRAMVLPLLLLFALSWVPFGRVVGVEWRALYPVYLRAAPFRCVNGYGLFAVMTKTRNEITIQGSDDGVTWEDYGFRWKPGDPMRRPRFCVGHMPRLDWQMWFASLGDVRGNRWLVNTLHRILEGEPEVLALLGRNPFPDGPPRFVRAIAQPYRFTTFEERRETGAWWKVEGEPRPYCPVLRLPDPRHTEDRAGKPRQVRRSSGNVPIASLGGFARWYAWHGGFRGYVG